MNNRASHTQAPHPRLDPARSANFRVQPFEAIVAATARLPRAARIVVRRARRLQLKLAEINDFHHDFRNIRFPPRGYTLQFALQFAP
ncbi:hypothetical protein [Paraburkholderia sp. 35.1]|uniref:hypothetical protein n=1 Tax=unclassified Paraburkholderia TaxID=2615204 RepID=UPI003D2220BC